MQKLVLGQKGKYIFILFLIGVVFGYTMLIDNVNLFYDTSLYWSLGYSFWNEAGFGFLNFPVSHRGYLLPFILGVCAQESLKFFQHEFILYRLLYSIVLVLMITVLIPNLFSDKSEKSGVRYYFGAIGEVVLFIIFWKDLVLYPLSDLIGAALFVFAVMLISKQGVRENLGSALFAGMAAYAAYNIRTVYLYPLLGGALFFFGWDIYQHILRKEDRKKWGKLITRIMLLIVGICVVAAPQMYINKQHHDKFTPMVITEYNENDNLFIAQLAWGIDTPRYETYVGNREEYPSGAVYFKNKVGNSLMETESIEGFSDYVSFVLHYLPEMIGVYAEHMMSGFIMFFDEVYVEKLAINPFVFALNFILWITAAIGVLSFFENRNIISRSRLILIVWLILPALMSVPGALENRFLIIPYLLMYAYLCYFVDYKELVKYFKANKIKTITIVLLALAVYCMSANMLMGELAGGMLNIGEDVRLY